MNEVGRMWPTGAWLAIVLSLWGCNGKTGAAAEVGATSAALLAADGGGDAELPGEEDSGVNACVQVARDATCDGVDDDCDGRMDEDFDTRCMFGTIALHCVDGAPFAEICDDANVCTVDSCGPGGCRHAELPCDDGNPCTAERCDPVSGCVSEPVPGLACDDGDACTSGDACDASGSCQPGTSSALDDGNPCTDDSCDPAGGAVHIAVPGRACDDGNVCTEDDACNADAVCAGVLLASIEDGDLCTDDQCDPVDGSVVRVRRAPGESCSDGDACNGSETCQGLAAMQTQISARQTFLRTEPTDSILPPAVIRLSDHGLGPGREVRMRTERILNSPYDQVWVVFSRDNVLLDHTEQFRVPGAIQSDAPPRASLPVSRLPTDIPEDFRITPAGMTVTIPPGARFVMFGIADVWYGDNKGDTLIHVEPLHEECVAGEPPVLDDGNACTADMCDSVGGVSHPPVASGTTCQPAAGGAGACDEGECFACSDRPDLCGI